jgi:hypothetical protein
LVEPSMSTWWLSSFDLVSHGGGDSGSSSAHCCLYDGDSSRIAMVVAYAMIFRLMSTPPLAILATKFVTDSLVWSGLSKIVSVATVFVRAP